MTTDPLAADFESVLSIYVHCYFYCPLFFHSLTYFSILASYTSKAILPALFSMTLTLYYVLVFRSIMYLVCKIYTQLGCILVSLMTYLWTWSMKYICHSVITHSSHLMKCVSTSCLILHTCPTHYTK